MIKILKRIVKKILFLVDPDYRFIREAGEGKYDEMPDDEYCKRLYKAQIKKDLNLDNPKTFSEKLQWLKCYYHKPEYTMMVDKLAVKKYVSDLIGEEYVLPALKVWNSVDDIEIDDLPNQFVLKCNNDSGSIVICKDKEMFDLGAAKEKLRPSFYKNYYLSGREWPYKNIVPKVFTEPYLDSLGKPESVEYKFTCADGKLCFGTICKGIAHAKFSQRTNDSYDENFNLMPWYAFYKQSKDPAKVKPAHYDEMVQLAEKLSVGIPSCRVDFYIHNDKVYFGEITFYTWAGFLKFTPDEWDLKLGKYITLPEEKII